MPGQFTNEIRISTTNLADSAKTSIVIPTGYLLRELVLDLSMQPTLTAANNTAANAGRADEWTYIRRVELTADGETLRSLSGAELVWLNYFMLRTIAQRNAQLGDATTANPVLRSQLVLPLWNVGGLTPIDSQLDTSRYTSLRLDITTGPVTDVNSAATAWTTAPTIQVCAYQAVGITGPFSQSYALSREYAFAGAVTQQRCSLDVGNGVYRGFLVNYRNAATEVDTATMTELRLVSGTTVIRDYDATVQRFLSRYRGEQFFPIGARGADVPFLASSNSVRNAWNFIDLAPIVAGGYLSEGFDARGVSNLDLQVSTSVAGRLTVLPLLFVPPARK